MTEAISTAIDALRVEREFDHPAQAVFDAWTNPEVMKRWLHAGPGWETPSATSEPRVGGQTRLLMRSPEGTEAEWTGEYTEFDPPRRVAFTFQWGESSPQDIGIPMHVELDFIETDGRTKCILTQTGFATEESREDHGKGWNLCFDNLESKAFAS